VGPTVSIVDMQLVKSFSDGLTAHIQFREVMALLLGYRLCKYNTQMRVNVSVIFVLTILSISCTPCYKCKKSMIVLLQTVTDNTLSFFMQSYIQFSLVHIPHSIEIF